MNAYQNIIHKLEQFYTKYYVNELLKGVILLVAFGVFYFLITLFVESVLWLNPTGRTVLFWLFVGMETALIIKLIVVPIIKLLRLSKGISPVESSTIIGAYFPEVQDKLLNILQLKEKSEETDLLMASIAQKSANLHPIPFTKAIDFKANLKYIPLLFLPFAVWLLFFMTGLQSDISKSLSRVVNYTEEYRPPAPFSFQLTNQNIEVIQGADYTLQINTVGSVIPTDVTIHYNKETYFLKNASPGRFTYLFEDIQQPVSFYLEANGVVSTTYTIEVIETPILKNISISVKNPAYTKKKDILDQPIGNLSVPEGAILTWDVLTQKTDSVHFFDPSKTSFTHIGDQQFRLEKKMTKPISYQIASSNLKIKNYEKLGFTVSVIKDEYPSIRVEDNIDSILRNQGVFAGQISDDYGLTKLQLVYYEKYSPTALNTVQIPISKDPLQAFLVQFPDTLTIEKGKAYELYFQVLDNDRVNGPKTSKSKTFSFDFRTDDEIAQELLKEQKEVLKTMENNLKQQQSEKNKLTKIQNDLKDKKNVDWNDKKSIENFLERQKQYKQMMQRQTEQLQENLLEKKTSNKGLQEQKEELQKRLEELKELQKEQNLLKELEKLTQKLDKNRLLEKTKELAEKNKQQERSLERILELTKRFYVEEKTMQLANELDKLSKKQDSLSQQDNPKLEDQEQINKDFDGLKKELETLLKDNEKLKEPMEIPSLATEKKETDKALQKSSENLQNKQSKEAKESQKKASKQLKKMSQQLQQSMEEMQANMIDENIDDLRKILENMVLFSFKQEELMTLFQQRSVDHPSFGADLKQQNLLKTYFEHIDDSLYVLSMRVPSISATIEKDLTDAHYNLKQSLENFAESRFGSGVSNQRYVMTAANNLADFLSNMLNSMQQNAKMSSKGKGKGKSFSLPDIIKQQQGLTQKMEQGKKKGESNKQENKGDKKGNGQNEELTGELYEIFKQQQSLREQLEDALKKGEGNGTPQTEEVLKSMEQLEQKLLEKGFTNEVLQQMRQLEYQLLKLDKAAFEQNNDTKRKSTTADQLKKQQIIKSLQLKKQFYNQIEILNRQSLPLQQKYKRKVQEYFSKKQG